MHLFRRSAPSSESAPLDIEGGDSTDGLILSPPPDRTLRRGRPWLRYIMEAFFLILLAGAGIAVILLYRLGGSLSDPVLKDPASIAFGDQQRLNILFLGLDYNHTREGIRYTKHSRTDTMFVVSIDRSAGVFNVVSIPRDTRVEIPGHGLHKINEAYAYKERGDLALTIRTVEKFLNVHIDHHVIIREYAAQRLVDALGGVAVNVEKNMDYDDNWGDLHIHLKKGWQRLNGKQAVGYVRFRKDEEGDRGRMRRQQQFMQATMKEVKQLSTLTRVNDLARALRDNVDTDMHFKQMVAAAYLYRSFDRSRMRTARIDGRDAVYDGLCYIDADEQQKERVVAQLLKDPNAFSIRDVRLEILNGSDVNGAATRLADLFRSKGYQVVGVGNAPTGAERTLILDHSNDRRACQSVTKVVGVVSVRTEPRPHPRVDLTIVLGRDWRTRAQQLDHPM